MSTVFTYPVSFASCFYSTILTKRFLLISLIEEQDSNILSEDHEVLSEVIEREFGGPSSRSKEAEKLTDIEKFSNLAQHMAKRDLPSEDDEVCEFIIIISY